MRDEIDALRESMIVEQGDQRPNIDFVGQAWCRQWSRNQDTPPPTTDFDQDFERLASDGLAACQIGRIYGILSKYHHDYFSV